ncbi:MAG: glycosyltransferase family 2 protein [Candidatus Daviesbacteria bacterium]|nr:glycosyltransferase family 2 protein [Candidatus Daviesbacteria bacterium]
MKIWVNTIVNNEENFIWFAVMSVVDYVDKILIWDTGSTDRTVEIIKELIKVKGNKISFKEVGEVDKYKFSKMRQEMLEETQSDWILILDGDEIWWEDSIKKLIDFINKNGKNYESAVTPFINAIGDIYHYQSEEAGKYELIGKKGHLTIRAMRKDIPGLHVGGSYGIEGYLDKENNPIQKRDPRKIAFIDAPFLHLTHLKRSSIDIHHKFKYELGLKFPKNFRYPQVLKKDRPDIVLSPFSKRNVLYEVIGLLKFPYLSLKRNI